MEKQSKLSVLPYLMIETSNNGYDNEFYIDIANYGVGPAIITKRIIYYKGKAYNMEFFDFLKTQIKEMDSINVISNSTLNEGLSIPAGKSRLVIKVGGNVTSYTNFLKIMGALQEEGNDFNYEIQYRSIYNDHWKITSDSETPIEL